MLPIEHPFDVMKTKLQSKQQKHQIWKLFQNTYKQQGLFKGIYAGFLPSAVRVTIKQIYRWPMIVYFSQFYEKYFQNGLHKIIAGATIAMIESFIICPLERLKVDFITDKNYHQRSLAQFLRQNGFLSLYRGLSIVIQKQIVSWTSFLYFEYLFKQILLQISESSQLDNTQLLINGILVGIVNCLIVYPFDSIKTHIQKNKFDKSLSSRQLFDQIYKSNGIYGFYQGFQLRLFQYMIQSIGQCYLINYLENSWKNNNKNY